jgi:glycosyltransferase involved in cell wall biosynthesis
LESFKPIDWNEKNDDIIYSGGITEIRGAIEMAKVAKKLQKTIHFFGPVDPQQIQQEMLNIEDKFVKLYGNIEQSNLFAICQKASIGLILFHPVPNHINCSPNKLFEYMSSGMAVVASDFPVWKAIVEKYDCGVCVNSLDIDSITMGINELLENPEKMKRMGENGRNAVLEHFNWEIESQTLIDFYNNITL